MGRAILALLFLGAASVPAWADYDCAYDPARTHMSRIIAADSTNVYWSLSIAQGIVRKLKGADPVLRGIEQLGRLRIGAAGPGRTEGTCKTLRRIIARKSRNIQ